MYLNHIQHQQQQHLRLQNVHENNAYQHYQQHAHHNNPHHHIVRSESVVTVTEQQIIGHEQTGNVLNGTSSISANTNDDSATASSSSSFLTGSLVLDQANNRHLIALSSDSSISTSTYKEFDFILDGLKPAKRQDQITSNSNDTDDVLCKNLNIFAQLQGSFRH